MNYVVITTDGNPQYFNFVPITAASWMRLGWTPLIGVVNTEMNPNCEAEFIHIEESRIKSCRTAMPFRFVIANHCSFIKDSDILITTDADSIIINTPWMKDALEYADKGFMVSIAHKWPYPIVAAWYLISTVKTWRELFPWTIQQLVTDNFEDLNGETGYCFDERFAYKIYQENKERFKFIIRQQNDRINLSSLKDICDIHCHIGPRVYDI